MSKLQYPAHNPNIHKKKKVFRTCKGSFMHVKCAECDEQTICYSHSQMSIKCDKCGTMILKSSGGKALLMNSATFKIAENKY